jgi:hypothetical protein
MKRWRKIGAVCLVGLVAIYIGIFSYWWLSGSVTTTVVDGQKHRVVEVHQSDFMYHTQPVWEPAFWFMVHVRGYRYSGYIAEGEASRFVYLK